MILRIRHLASRRWAAEWLHLVDLNGAFAGKPVNAAAVEAILKSVKIPVQLGGGIRHLAQIEDWFARGIARVILGTAALKNPALVKEACRKFPGKIAVGIDAKGGKVAVEGWAETSDVTALDLARKFEDAGAAVIIFTDIDRDGLLQGVNVESTAQAGAQHLGAGDRVGRRLVAGRHRVVAQDRAEHALLWRRHARRRSSRARPRWRAASPSP